MNAPGSGVPIVVRSADGERVMATWGERPLFTYTAVSHEPAEHAPRPFMHPMFTPGGALVSDARPADHPWHIGLSMTWTYIMCEQTGRPAHEANFWGGPSYRPETGYAQQANIGRVRHLGWEVGAADGFAGATDGFAGASSGFAHRLAWEAADGTPWLDETRRVGVRMLYSDGQAKDSAPAGWAADWDMRFRNVSGGALVLETPASRGLAGIGYGGLFLRAHPAFTAKRGGVLHDAAGGVGESAVMGSAAAWAGLRSAHAVIVMRGGPENPRTPHTDPPARWWGRTGQYAGLCAALVYDAPLRLEPGALLRLRYTVEVWDG